MVGHARINVWSAVRYFPRHPLRTVAVIASDPIEAGITIHERISNRLERRAPPDLYQAEKSWESRLHNLLGLPWPCLAASEFWAIWPKIIEQLSAKGVRVGPDSFSSWNDGDAGFCASDLVFGPTPFAQQGD